MLGKTNNNISITTAVILAASRGFLLGGMLIAIARVIMSVLNLALGFFAGSVEISIIGLIWLPLILVLENFFWTFIGGIMFILPTAVVVLGIYSFLFRATWLQGQQLIFAKIISAAAIFLPIFILGFDCRISFDTLFIFLGILFGTFSAIESLNQNLSKRAGSPNIELKNSNSSEELLDSILTNTSKLVPFTQKGIELLKKKKRLLIILGIVILSLLIINSHGTGLLREIEQLIKIIAFFLFIGSIFFSARHFATTKTKRISGIIVGSCGLVFLYFIKLRADVAMEKLSHYPAPGLVIVPLLVYGGLLIFGICLLALLLGSLFPKRGK